jgi:hypothetical protein
MVAGNCCLSDSVADLLISRLARNHDSRQAGGSVRETHFVRKRQTAEFQDVVNAGTPESSNLKNFEELPRRVWTDPLASTVPLRMRLFLACVMLEMNLHLPVQQPNRILQPLALPPFICRRYRAFVGKAQLRSDEVIKSSQKIQVAFGRYKQANERGLILHSQSLVNMRSPAIVRNDCELCVSYEISKKRSERCAI